MISYSGYFPCSKCGKRIGPIENYIDGEILFCHECIGVKMTKKYAIAALFKDAEDEEVLKMIIKKVLMIMTHIKTHLNSMNLHQSLLKDIEYQCGILSR